MASSCKEMSTPVNTNPKTQTEMCPAPLVDICMRDLLKTSVADVTTCSPDRVKWPPNGFLPCTLLPHAFAVGSNHGHHAFDQAPACALPDRGEMYSPSGLLQQWVMTGMFVRCKERLKHSFIHSYAHHKDLAGSKKSVPSPGVSTFVCKYLRPWCYRTRASGWKTP